MKKSLISFSILSLIFLSSITMSFQRNMLNSIADNSFDSWHFIALGDSRNWIDNSSNYYRKKIFENIMENNPNLKFILHTGDMAKAGGEQDDWDLYYEDINLLVQNNVSFYYAVGNHEKYTYQLENGSWGPFEMDFSTYMSNVELPGNERYYSFDYRGIHFLFINTDEYWVYDDPSEFNITAEQKNWIINDLENNTNNYTIATFHRSLYSVRDQKRARDARAARTVLEPILLEYNVDLIFSGHDHLYYRTKRKGIQHIITGGAGARLAGIYFPEGAIGYDKYFSKYHYCNVTITEELLTIEVHVFDDILRHTTIEDTLIINLIEPLKTKTTFYYNFIILLFWIIPLLRRKKRK